MTKDDRVAGANEPLGQRAKKEADIGEAQSDEEKEAAEKNGSACNLQTGEAIFEDRPSCQ
jgi:hypothetical protein